MTLYQAPDLPTKPEPSKGIMGGAIADIKGAAGQAIAATRKRVEQSQQSTTTRLSKAELRRAKEYEEKRKIELAGERKRGNRRATNKESR